MQIFLNNIYILYIIYNMESETNFNIYLIIAVCVLLVIGLIFLINKGLNLSVVKRNIGDPLVEVDVYNKLNRKSNVNKKCTDNLCKVDEKDMPINKQIDNINRTKEVFNISKNIYKYNDANALCKALNSRLATFEEVKNAYENGADWCNYGWSKGQMALYPTQKSTWKKLQNGPKKYRNDCGQPGVNGGYFDNPNLKFGVNCYGYKPKMSESDKENVNFSSVPRLSKKEKIELQKIKEYRSERERGDIEILPFRKNCWNKEKYEDEVMNGMNINNDNEYDGNLEEEIAQGNNNPLDRTIETGLNINENLLDNISDNVVDINNSLNEQVSIISNQKSDILPKEDHTSIIGNIGNEIDNNFKVSGNKVLKNIDNSVSEIPNEVGLKMKKTFNNIMSVLF